MAGMLGYGLAKVGEGITGGLLHGTLMQKQMEMAQAKEGRSTALKMLEMGQKERQHTETLGQKTKEHQEKMDLEKQKFVYQKLGAALDAANKVLQFTEDGEAATKVLQGFYGKDEQSPIKGIKLEPKTKEMHFDLGDGIIVIKDKSVLDDLSQIFTNNPESGQEAIQEAVKVGVAVWLPKGEKPISEYESKRVGQEEENIGLRKAGLRLKGREVAVKEREAGIKTKDDELKIRATLRQIEKDRAALKSKGVTSEILNMITDPTAKAMLAGIVGQKLSAQDLKKAEGVFDEEVKALRARLPKEKTEEEKKPKATHRYIPGKGLVKIEEEGLAAGH